MRRRSHKQLRLEESSQARRILSLEDLAKHTLAAAAECLVGGAEELAEAKSAIGVQFCEFLYLESRGMESLGSCGSLGHLRYWAES